MNTHIDWKPMDDFVKNNTDIPNRLVFLRIKRPTDHALYDVEEDKSFTTMGHWFPDPDYNGEGKWICVGWDWDDDEFCDCNDFRVEAWAEIPE